MRIWSWDIHSTISSPPPPKKKDVQSPKVLIFSTLHWIKSISERVREEKINVSLTQLHIIDHKRWQAATCYIHITHYKHIEGIMHNVCCMFFFLFSKIFFGGDRTLQISLSVCPLLYIVSLLSTSVAPWSIFPTHLIFFKINI